MSAGRLARLCLAVLLVAGPARAADTADGSFQSVTRFMERNGEAVFVHVCAGCHMPDAKGAVGAARYPALAQNRKLSVASYAVFWVARGAPVRPSFGDFWAPGRVELCAHCVRANFDKSCQDAGPPESVGAGGLSLQPPPAH